MTYSTRRTHTYHAHKNSHGRRLLEGTPEQQLHTFLQVSDGNMDKVHGLLDRFYGDLVWPRSQISKRTPPVKAFNGKWYFANIDIEFYEIDDRWEPQAADCPACGGYTARYAFDGRDAVVEPDEDGPQYADAIGPYRKCDQCTAWIRPKWFSAMAIYPIRPRTATDWLPDIAVSWMCGGWRGIGMETLSAGIRHSVYTTPKTGSADDAIPYMYSEVQGKFEDVWTAGSARVDGPLHTAVHAFSAGTETLVLQVDADGDPTIATDRGDIRCGEVNSGVCEAPPIKRAMANRARDWALLIPHNDDDHIDAVDITTERGRAIVAEEVMEWVTVGTAMDRALSGWHEVVGAIMDEVPRAQWRESAVWEVADAMLRTITHKIEGHTI